MDEVFTDSRVAYLALGSNLGDRSANLDDAISRLRARSGIAVVAQAAVIETAPMYVASQPEFLNTCIAIRTTLSAHALLDACLAVEGEMGRVRVEDKGPRNIDIDIVLFGDLVLDDERLTLPHPAMLDREFVLVPLAEIAAAVHHPVTGRTISEERDRCHHSTPQEAVDDERDIPQ